jgi:hypothetical protein
MPVETILVSSAAVAVGIALVVMARRRTGGSRWMRRAGWGLGAGGAVVLALVALVNFLGEYIATVERIYSGDAELLSGFDTFPPPLAPTRPAPGRGAIIEPTRTFLPPHSVPPEGYRGYGLIAFTALATAADIDRHRTICGAFLAAMIPTGAARSAPEGQFLTGWPVRDGQVAARLNADTRPIDAICTDAIAQYDLVTAQYVLGIARQAGDIASGRGPFLLAWSPTDSFGDPEALVLTLDLSRVEDYETALVFMNDWKSDIQQDFDILARGFSLERLRVKIRRWADAHGEGYLSLLTGG